MFELHQAQSLIMFQPTKNVMAGSQNRKQTNLTQQRVKEHIINFQQSYERA